LDAICCCEVFGCLLLAGSLASSANDKTEDEDITTRVIMEVFARE
jgi:hypothetical protein